MQKKRESGCVKKVSGLIYSPWGTPESEWLQIVLSTEMIIGKVAHSSKVGIKFWCQQPVAFTSLVRWEKRSGGSGFQKPSSHINRGKRAGWRCDCDCGPGLVRRGGDSVQEMHSSGCCLCMKCKWGLHLYSLYHFLRNCGWWIRMKEARRVWGQSGEGLR